MLSLINKDVNALFGYTKVDYGRVNQACDSIMLKHGIKCFLHAVPS